MQAILDFLLHWNFLGVSLAKWASAAAVFLISLVVLIVLRRLMLLRFGQTASHTRFNTHDVALDLLKYTRTYFILAIAAYLASLFLVISPQLMSTLRIIFIALVLLQVARWGSRMIAIYVSDAITRGVEEQRDNTATINLLGILAQVILWVIIILLILSNAHFDVSTLVASLGITGIAVAFALQRILADLFASFSIALDKPFVIGDYIVVGDQQGTVEHIGLKSTRIRSLTGEQIIISNSDLLASRIQNFKRMRERRIHFTLRLSPKTALEKLAQVPGIVENIITTLPDVRFTRANFSEIGDTYLLFDIVYFTLSPDYDLYMDVQQRINLAILRAFETEQILFSFQ